MKRRDFLQSTAIAGFGLMTGLSVEKSGSPHTWVATYKSGTPAGAVYLKREVYAENGWNFIEQVTDPRGLTKVWINGIPCTGYARLIDPAPHLDCCPRHVFWDEKAGFVG